MRVRILILILISPAVVCPVREVASGFGEGGRGAPPAAFAAVVDRDDGSICGECPCPDPEPDGSREARSVSAHRAREAAAARGGRSGARGQGLGPVLASLSDSLTIGRPPPALPPRRSGSPG